MDALLGAQMRRVSWRIRKSVSGAWQNLGDIAITGFWKPFASFPSWKIIVQMDLMDVKLDSLYADKRIIAAIEQLSMLQNEPTRETTQT